jgi:hypothetical protein
MSAGPEIKIHRDIAIRYGYSIGDDLFHAHFDLPEKHDVAFGFQRGMQNNMAPTLKPGKYHHWNVSEEALLAGVCTDIDRYFDE